MCSLLSGIAKRLIGAIVAVRTMSIALEKIHSYTSTNELEIIDAYQLMLQLWSQGQIHTQALEG